MSITREVKIAMAAAFGLFFAAGGVSEGSEGPGLEKDSYSCRPVTEENLKPPPPPLPMPTGDTGKETRVLRDFADASKLDDEPCAAGRIAYPLAAGGVHGPGPAAYESAKLQRTRSADAEESSDWVWDGFSYVDTYFNSVGIGGFVKMNVAQPKVSRATGRTNHSIAEISFLRYPTDGYTLELGWRVLSGPEKRPQLFTFVNKDHYASYGDPGGDCYDCHFVPAAGADYVPGQFLVPSDNNLETLQLGALYWNDDWWIWVGDQWIGYIEGSFWPDPFNFTAKRYIYGEVYDLSRTSEMGNGVLGTEPGASLMADPTVLTYKDGQLLPHAETMSDQHGLFWGNEIYAGGNISEDRTSWKFGGPGL